MRLLTAAHRDDELDTGVVPGELVFPCPVHLDVVSDGILCPCRCSILFVGIASDQYTSVAVVRDIDVAAGDLLRLAVEHVVRVEGRPVDDDILDQATSAVEQMVLAGSSFTVGDVVYRAGPRLTSRERPERGIGHLRADR